MAEKISAAQHEAYQRISSGEEFAELKKNYIGFVFPMTVAFMVWYLLFVILSNWAPDFMSTRLFGNINIALVFGLLQFVTTFGIAFLYSRFAAAKLDPLAGRLQARYDEEESR